MVLKISTKDGWVYYDDIVSLEIVNALYKLEPLKETTEGGQGEYPQFYTHEESMLFPTHIHTVGEVTPVGATPPEYWQGRYAKCLLPCGETRTIGFNGEAYLLNNDGKTVDRFRH